jgi:Cdc6-like AAA superfamily ATPase
VVFSVNVALITLHCALSPRQTSTDVAAEALLCRKEQLNELCSEMQCHMSDSTVSFTRVFVVTEVEWCNSSHRVLRSHLAVLVAQAASLYISGPPGTGKSFTASLAVRECHRWAAENGIARPSIVWINCMSLGQPRHIFQVSSSTSHTTRPSSAARHPMSSGCPPPFH